LGAIVPIHERASASAAAARGLSTVGAPSWSSTVPPPLEAIHSSALQVRPS
jgi:hypothetical protein